MSRVAVARHWRIPGFDGVRKNVQAAYEVLDLRDALERRYKTDAHLVAYVVTGATRQPRINKPGLQLFEHPVEMEVFFCDIDNPNHSFWTDDMFAEAMEQYDTLDILQTAGVYHTARGRRIVQPIDKPIPVQEVEPYIQRWFFELERAGLEVDWSCRDWTRHYRLPNVIRGGACYRSPWVSLGRMQPITLAPLSTDFEWQLSPRMTNTAGPSPPPKSPPKISWNAELSPFWRERVESIAKAVCEVKTEWHTLFLAIAGAFLSRDVPPEQVPGLCRAISIATGCDSRTDDREISARTTVMRQLSGLPTTGYGQLAAKWPDVAMAIDVATASGTDAHMPTVTTPPSNAPSSLKETTVSLEECIRSAPPGVTLVSAECGLGKTEAAIRIAAERAAKPYSSPNATGTRAPLQSKTSISVDKNALAEQVQDRLAQLGVLAKRIFGPLSVLRDDGTPECRFHEVAKPLVAGGQSLQRELCEGRGRFRCEHYQNCSAKLGYEGPDDARVTIGTHALISALDTAAGTTGLLVIDEPPYLLETSPITLDDLAQTETTLSAFDRDYTDAMRPALAAVRIWLDNATEETRSMALKDAVRTFSHEIDPLLLNVAQVAAETGGDAVECAVNAPLLDARNQAPPLRQVEISRAKFSIARAKQLGIASRVLGRIHHTLTAPWQVIGSVEEVAGQPVLVITAARRDLTEALRRDGAVVVMDANIGIHSDIYEKALGYKPPLHNFQAMDGAPIERTHLWCSSASRTHWMRGGKLVPKPSLVNAIREIFKWTKADPPAKKLGLITLKPIRLALEAILNPEDKSIMDEWERMGQLNGTLKDLHQKLGPIISDWNGEVVLGHYGAVRGLNTMADVDCLVTLGDPWPNIGQVARDMDYMGMKANSDARMEALCRAELEQAHGRLRTVHRKRPGRALHVGRVLPGGSGWCNGRVKCERMTVGRPPSTSPMSREELETIISDFGSVSAAARAAGCSRQYLIRRRDGKRPISNKIIHNLRSSEGCNQNSFSIYSL